jgi:hypothetical protein
MMQTVTKVSTVTQHRHQGHEKLYDGHAGGSCQAFIHSINHSVNDPRMKHRRLIPSPS